MNKPRCGVCEYDIPDRLPSGWAMLGTPIDRSFIRVNEACPIHGKEKE